MNRINADPNDVERAQRHCQGHRSHDMSTDNYDLWLLDEKRDRLKRMADALMNDIMLQDGISAELRLEARTRAMRWLEEASAKPAY